MPARKKRVARKKRAAKPTDAMTWSDLLRFIDKFEEKLKEQMKDVTSSLSMGRHLGSQPWKPQAAQAPALSGASAPRPAPPSLSPWLGSRTGTVRGRVKNGRFVVDEPTSFPEGTEIELSLLTATKRWDLLSERFEAWMAEIRAEKGEADRKGGAAPDVQSPR